MRIILLATLTLFLTNCAELKKFLSSETCSVIVSKEDGYLELCESGSLYRIKPISREEYFAKSSSRQ